MREIWGFLPGFWIFKKCPWIVCQINSLPGMDRRVPTWRGQVAGERYVIKRFVKSQKRRSELRQETILSARKAFSCRSLKSHSGLKNHYIEKRKTLYYHKIM